MVRLARPVHRGSLDLTENRALQDPLVRRERLARKESRGPQVKTARKAPPVPRGCRASLDLRVTWA